MTFVKTTFTPSITLSVKSVIVVTCGKKKPEIQYTAGMPPSTQPRMNWVLISRSSTQAPSGFSEGYALPAHISGTYRT